jgi:Ni/Fe-hydrogenase subunit HybB-like protein
MAATPPPAAPEPTASRGDNVAGVVPRRFFPIAAIVLGLGLLILVLGYFGDEEEDDAVIPFIVITVATLAIGYLVWRYVVLPRASGREADVAGIIVGALSIVFALFYWTGAVYVLAPAAIALGVYAREGGDRQKGSIALILGWIALLGALVIGAADTMG